MFFIKNSPQPKQDSEQSSEIALSAALLKEYDGLLNLYTHTENSINSIFNFYVTLLTTITGAVIVLVQVSQASQENLYWTIAALLVLITLVGVITQDFLIYKDAEMAYLTTSINSVKEYLFKNFPEAQARLFFLSNPYSHIRTIVNPLKRHPKKIEKFEKYFWWTLPLGMPQLFVSLMNSLAVTIIFILLVMSVMHDDLPIFRVGIASVLVLTASYIVQCIYANLKFKTKISDSHIAMNGQVHSWFTDPRK